MKLPALAVTAFSVAAFIGGTAAAQTSPPVTMQPIPNPPENGKSTGMTMHHHTHEHMHHHVHVHHKASSETPAPADNSAAPAPGASDNNAPPSPQ